VAQVRQEGGQEQPQPEVVQYNTTLGGAANSDHFNSMVTLMLSCMTC
jgi:hypothetical protein